MTATFKGFFGSLVLFMVFSTILCYAGIEKMHRNGASDSTDLDASFSNPFNIIGFLDSLTGKITAWGVILVVPTLCGILAFRHGQFVLYGMILCSLAVVYGWVGLGTFINATMFGPF